VQRERALPVTGMRARVVDESPERANLLSEGLEQLEADVIVIDTGLRSSDGSSSPSASWWSEPKDCS
jgi:hypothetical protein